ncbi:hypothetical protein [Paenibacillus shenyangensis]|uniref:hypothetical protein n=1 Tax=Paenibacillus sp. A9 TaxID=1284352 RepID=UPI001EE724D7|nr:hypothetical protein [Paenibacillus sp. A9]
MKYTALLLQLAVVIGSVLIIEWLLFYEKSTGALIGGFLLAGILFVISLIVVYRVTKQDDLFLFVVRAVVVIVVITVIFGAVTALGLGRPAAEGFVLAFKMMIFAMMILLVSQIGKKVM